MWVSKGNFDMEEETSVVSLSAGGVYQMVSTR